MNDDLRRHGGLRLVVAQHRALDLAGVDRRLHQDLAVETQRGAQRRFQLGRGLDLADPDRRSGVGRFDEHREAQLRGARQRSRAVARKFARA